MAKTDFFGQKGPLPNGPPKYATVLLMMMYSKLVAIIMLKIQKVVKIYEISKIIQYQFWSVDTILSTCLYVAFEV